MSKETFHRVLELACSDGGPVTLGGGEPTLHPQLMEFLWLSIRALADATHDLGMPAVGLVTNGSQTETALELASLARIGVIWASVSKDEFHDPIDPRVFRAFEASKSETDYRRINRLGLIVPAGRAKNWGNHPFLRCACDGPFVTPSGDVYSCGCRRRKLGNVSEPGFEFTQDWHELGCALAEQATTAD